MTDIELARDRLGKFQIEISESMKIAFERADFKADLELSKHGEHAFEVLKDFCLRDSKRIRGSLVMLTYKMFGGKQHQAALDAAVAVELIQNYLLIVDDVMDRSAARRNGPTVHVQYLDELKNLSESEATHFSNMVAINIGLIAQHIASQLLSKADETPENLIKAHHYFHKNILATGFGQIEDLYNNTIHDASEEDVINLQKLKSSYYTFINPTQIGAILAGADDKALESLATFGEAAGVAFQIHDDIIGLFGDEDVTGKSSMDDVKEGKQTLLILKAIEFANKDDAQFISDNLGNQSLTKKAHERIQKTVKDSKSLDYSIKIAKKYAKQAISAIQDQSWDVEGKRQLRGLVEYSINRVR